MISWMVRLTLTATAAADSARACWSVLAVWAADCDCVVAWQSLRQPDCSCHTSWITSAELAATDAGAVAVAAGVGVASAVAVLAGVGVAPAVAVVDGAAVLAGVGVAPAVAV